MVSIFEQQGRHNRRHGICARNKNQHCWSAVVPDTESYVGTVTFRTWNGCNLEVISPTFFIGICSGNPHTLWQASRAMRDLPAVNSPTKSANKKVVGEKHEIGPEVVVI